MMIMTGRIINYSLCAKTPDLYAGVQVTVNVGLKYNSALTHIS